MKIINNKKGASMMMIFFSIFLFIAMFSGLYLFYQNQLSEGGLTPDSRYSQLYENMSVRHVELKEKTDNLRDTISDISETENLLLQGWYGLKGVGQALLILPSVITIGVDTFMDSVQPFDFVPPWAIAVAVSAVVVLILFIVLKSLRGTPTDI